MDRMQAIQLAIEVTQAKSYLEIGCQNDVCFSQIVCDLKIGVDPFSGGTHRMTSDDFFSQLANENGEGSCFDVIFIDGDHHHAQVYRDIANSVQRLNPGGIILMHDCNPHDLQHEGLNLCGSVWRAFVAHRQNLNLDAIVGDFDYGVGAIRVRKNSAPIQIPGSFHDLGYYDLVAHRHDWMRLQPVEKFVEWIKNVDQ